MENIEYLKTMCPACDGALEFPAHALGQHAECPHCHKAIVLGSVALPPPQLPANEMFQDKARKTTVHLLYWLSGHKRQVVQAVCTLLICGVALFIYMDQKAEQRKRDQAAAAKAEADAKAKEDQAYWDAVQTAKAKKKADYAAWVDEQQRERAAKMEAQQANDAIVDKLTEINNTAERARMNAFIQNAEAISEMRQTRLNEEFTTPKPKPPKPWILRYNGWANQWQYAPPDAVLRYNGFQNRWEFVPN
jgi:hypothetical protein